MEYNWQFAKLGKIVETKHGWDITIKNEDGKISENFPNLDAALKFCEKIVRNIQNIQNIPLSIEYKRISGTKTFLCYKDKESKPKEYAPFDYYAFNSAFHPNWQRRTYMTPRYISYNAIARVSSAETVKFRRAKNIIDLVSFLVWISFAIVAILASLKPSQEAQGFATTLNLAANDPIAWGMTIFFQFLGFVYLVINNIPRIVFWKTSLSDVNKYGVRNKTYGEKKEWKTFYRSKMFSNIFGQLVLILAFVTLVVIAWRFEVSVYSEFSLKFKETYLIMLFAILALGMLVTQQAFLAYSMAKVRQKRERFLDDYVPKESKPYFRSWTIFKGVHDEPLEFNYNYFVYKPTQAELNETLEAMKRNVDLSKAKKTLIKRELTGMLQLGLVGLKDATKTLNMSRAKLQKEFAKERELIEKTAMMEKAAKKPTAAQIELQKTQMIERKFRMKEEEREQKMISLQSKKLKKEEAKRIKRAKVDRKRQIKIEREKMKNGLYW